MSWFNSYDHWKQDSGREHEDEEPRPEQCGFHKIPLTPDGRCENCDELDGELDREYRKRDDL